MRKLSILNKIWTKVSINSFLLIFDIPHLWCEELREFSLSIWSHLFRFFTLYSTSNIKNPHNHNKNMKAKTAKVKVWHQVYLETRKIRVTENNIPPKGVSCYHCVYMTMDITLYIIGEHEKQKWTVEVEKGNRWKEYAVKNLLSASEHHVMVHWAAVFYSSSDWRCHGYSNSVPVCAL